MVAIGRGVFILEFPGDPSQARTIGYSVQSDGLKFDDSTSGNSSNSLFDLLQTFTNGETFSKGHLSLASLPASPQDAFYDISLKTSTDLIELHIETSEAFAHRGSTFFEKLNITFTESRNSNTLQVNGTVHLRLFGRSDLDIELIPSLTATGLVFKPSDTSKAVDIDQLGRLNIKSLTVGRNNTLEDALQAIYTFDEPVGNIFRDNSGSTGADLNLESNKSIQRIPGGILIGDGTSNHGTILESTTAGTKLVNACQLSNALTIAAWVKPTRQFTEPNDNQLPARIVSLSKNANQRNFTLGQTVDNEKNNRYIVRLRRGTQHNNGTPALASTTGLLPTEDLDYVVFTRGDATSDEPSGKIYVNGENKTDLELNNLGSAEFSTDLSGDFSQWANDYPLLIGNEKKDNRPWDGEIHQVAIYSRALSQTEIFHSYFPSFIELDATLTLSNVPAPLDQELPVTIDLDENRLTLVQAGLQVSPFLQFNQVNFVWVQPTQTVALSGQVNATLWGNSVSFNVDLTANELKLSRADTEQTSLVLNDAEPQTPLGEVQLTQLTLTADRTLSATAWVLETDGQVTFAHIPPPFKGPFPVQLFLDAQDDPLNSQQLWLSISPDVPLTLVAGLQFNQANLRFVRDDQGWQVTPDLRNDRGGISLPLLCDTRPLSAQLEATETAKTLSLKWTADEIGEQLGKLNLSHFSLQSVPSPGDLFWQIGITGRLPLGLSTPDDQASIVDFSGLDFRSEDGELLGDATNLEDNHQALNLQGKSVLQHFDHPIFTGDLQLDDTHFLADGSLDLFGEWSMVQVKGEPRLEIDADGEVAIATIPAQVTLPDSILINPDLTLTDGRLSLSGFWLGQPERQVFYVRERADTIFLHGDTQLSLPFSINLPALIDNKTGAQLAPPVQLSDVPMTIALATEFRTTGFVSVLNGAFDYTDANNVPQTITLPERRLYTPPVSSAALLGDFVAELKESASELFQTQGRNQEDYYLTAGTQQPRVFLSATGSLETQIISDMPAVFKIDLEQPLENAVFNLTQLNGNCTLTLNLTGSNQTILRENYDNLLAQVAAKESFSAGAVAVLKRRIAERLPADYGSLLYYYYGWDVEQGYIDLQAGMRLRIDLQNYQFVQASDPTAQRGFVGSGSFYVPINTYTYPQSDGSHLQLLGFGPFLSQLQVNKNVVDITNDGAGSVFDLLQQGYRKAYYRLFFPKEPSVGSGAERFFTVIGADSLQEMMAATDAFVANGSSPPTVGSSFFFRGKAVISPEIQIHIGDTPTYVAIGTTLRQLVERYDDIPTAGLASQNLQAFSGLSRPLRLVHEGINSQPSYRFINFGEFAAAGTMDLLDLPLIKGDRLCF